MSNVEELARTLANVTRQTLTGPGSSFRWNGAAIVPNRGISRTEYTITGELANVLKAVESIFETYPGLGYGTYIKYMTQLGDGSYGAEMCRANSCD